MALALALLALTAGACGGADGDELRVFASASLTGAFTDLAEGFERREGVEVELQLAGTPVLVEQIARGAPVDVFASADAESARQVAARHGTVTSRRVFATNRLALVVAAGNPRGVRGLADVARSALVVAIAAAEVPAGRYARTALDRAGVTARPDTLEPSVKAIVSKVALGEVDVGVVYRTDVLAAGAGVGEVAIPPEQNVVTELVIAALAGAGEAAAAFVDFVFSEAGQAILRRAGFGPPAPEELGR